MCTGKARGKIDRLCIPRDSEVLGKRQMSWEWEISQSINGEKAQKNENRMNMHKTGFLLL